MRFPNRSAHLPQLSSFDPELRVTGYIATRRGDAERGPQIRLNPADARSRLLVDGEIARVAGPRGMQIAEVAVDERIAEHECVVRDIQGVDVSEAVRVSKPDFDTPVSERTVG